MKVRNYIPSFCIYDPVNLYILYTLRLFKSQIFKTLNFIPRGCLNLSYSLYIQTYLPNAMVGSYISFLSIVFTHIFDIAQFGPRYDF